MESVFKKVGSNPSPNRASPNWKDRAVRELRSSDSSGSSSSSRQDKEKGVHIQVLLRCRPLSNEEMKVRTPSVITCNENKREVSVIQNIGNKQVDRTFAFDKVFGPTSQQKDIFNHAIAPIVNEVLEGYNCTVFAYGQTGTGKTYTMEGGRKTKNGDCSEDAGVIPRSVRHIFEILESQNAEYSMKVSFIELYNEEITDLLAPEESKFSDDKSKKALLLMEDGKGGVLVRGLEEEIVKTANEIYKILDKGTAKRRTAETLLNKQSSRSHSIFTITIHIKECTLEGEEMIKSGKLNLVDLAGSENIMRSGARDGRAREAGEINKSLLTLGRAINALVEHSVHIPYRDSKLTRLLRDSLGGKTKTCIIATISPSIHCLEETLSTLDYAHRAKNIKNKPEVNQKMMKSAVIKDLYSEMDRLKQELYAAREKNGVYIPREQYIHEEAEKKAMSEKIEQFTLELELKDKKFVEMEDLYNSQKHINEEQSEKLEKTQKKLEDTEHAFSDLEEKYRQAIHIIKEKEYFISNLQKSEKALVQHAHGLRSELENAAADVSGLFAKIERKAVIEDENRTTVQKLRTQLSAQLDFLHTTVSSSVTQQESQLKEIEEEMLSFVATKSKATEQMCEQLEKLKESCGSGIRALDYLANELGVNLESTFEKLNSQIVMQYTALEKSFEGIAMEATKLLKELNDNLYKQEEKITSFAQKQREVALQTADTTRAISKVTNNFFHTLDVHASKLNTILEESRQLQDQQLCELEKKFEETSSNEEKLLLEKVVQMLASSSARKQEVVQIAVNNIRTSAAENTSTLRTEIFAGREINSSVRNEWAGYIEKAENNHLEETDLINTQENSFKEDLKQCIDNTISSMQQWDKAQDSLKNVEGETVTSIGSIIRIGSETNHLVRSKHASAASTITNDVDMANKDLISSINCSLKLDHDLNKNIHSTVVPCNEVLRDLNSAHTQKVSEISDNSREHLEVEYKMDEPTCSTPRRREINIPSIASIEEMRTPDFEELLKSFPETKSCVTSKQSNGEDKYISVLVDSADNRVPLATIN